MTFLETQTSFRKRLREGYKRRHIAVIDLGSYKISCMIFRIDREGARTALGGAGGLDAIMRGVSMVGACVTRSAGIRHGRIIDMQKTVLAMRHAIITAEENSGDALDRVDYAIIVASGDVRTEWRDRIDLEIETGRVSERDIGKAMRLDDAAVDALERDARFVMHGLPTDLAVDGRFGLTDPRGMSGSTLSAMRHVITADASAIETIQEAVRQCDVNLCGILHAGLAAGKAALVEDEQRLRSLCIDFGADNTKLVLFEKGSAILVADIGLGGRHVTQDLSIGLGTGFDVAETIKIHHGSMIRSNSDEVRQVEIPRRGEEAMNLGRTAPRSAILDIIRPRVEEIVSRIRDRLDTDGHDPVSLESVVITGGGARMPGLDDHLMGVFGKRPRLGTPLRIGGVPDELSGPEYSSAIGAGINSFFPDDEFWDFDKPYLLSGSRPGQVLHWLVRNL